MIALEGLLGQLRLYTQGAGAGKRRQRVEDIMFSRHRKLYAAEQLSVDVYMRQTSPKSHMKV